MSGAFRFKIADTPAEMQQIHRLNHRTFVDEIPQHAPRADGVLIDRFDAENTYVICLREEQLVGMIAVRCRRPFSLDEKLPDLDAHLPPGHSPCEIRLLAVDPGHRSGVVFRGLASRLAEYCLAEGCDLALISGTVRQLKLYRHIGFEPFGPLVGSGEALYQPMYLTLERFRDSAGVFLANPPGEPTSFLPGPVELRPEVRAALAAQPRSHRGDHFARDLAAVRRSLSALTGAPRVQVLLGSGTIANETVAAQLSLLDGPGLVLSNGEFGERLIDHARRWGLDFGVLRRGWGRVFGPGEVERALREAGARWLWMVHCETSTGVLNDLDAARAACASAGARLCVDCISSLGTVPVNLDGVFLATGVSGKGLGSVAGLALVLHHHEVAPSPRLPSYIDLGNYDETEGVPFTQSSNLLAALRAAVEGNGHPADRLRTLEADARALRAGLRSAGLSILAPDDRASPAVTTIVLPRRLAVSRVGPLLEESGYLLSYRSRYLLDRNWIQVCLMGAYDRARLLRLPATLQRAMAGLREKEQEIPSASRHAAT